MLIPGAAPADPTAGNGPPARSADRLREIVSVTHDGRPAADPRRQRAGYVSRGP